MITETASAMGADVSGGVDVMAADIAKQTGVTMRQVAEALYRCRVEIRGADGFPPRLTTPAILERMGIVYGDEADQLEAVAGWDSVVDVAARHARLRDEQWTLRRLVGKPEPECSACFGRGLEITEKDGNRVARDCRCRSITEIPDLSPRIRDVVRRMGGWGVFRDIDPKRYSFIRREFIAEFARWRKVEDHIHKLPPSERLRIGTGELSGIRKITAG